MPIARFYRMVSADHKDAELLVALTQLRRAVRSLEGVLEVELFRDTKNPSIFIFIEQWASIEAHKAAASKLPKDALGGVMAVLAGPPEGLTLECIGDD